MWALARKLIGSPNHARKNPKVKLGMKNLSILPSYCQVIGTFATLCVGSPHVFLSGKIMNLATGGRKRYDFEPA